MNPLTPMQIFGAIGAGAMGLAVLAYVYSTSKRGLDINRRGLPKHLHNRQMREHFERNGIVHAKSTGFFSRAIRKCVGGE